MDIRDALDMILSASGLPRVEMQIDDASLFRFQRTRTNVGLINADNLSVQIHINQVAPSGAAGGGLKSDSQSIPRMETERAASGDRASEGSGSGGPRVVDKHLFDVSNTFRFSPDFVFDERRLTINTIPIHFMRKGARIICDIRIRNVSLSAETFFVRDDELRMSEGAFERCASPVPDGPGPHLHDERLSRIVDHKQGRFYRNGGGLLVCLFPTAPGEALPLGRDDVIFPEDRFGPVHLVCVARSKPGNTYQIRSHFYVVTDSDGQS